MLHPVDLERAEQVLGDARGVPVHLHQVDEFREGRVVRCAVDGGAETVVVKVADRGGDLTKGIEAIRAERAALELLTERGAGIAARLLAADGDGGVLVIEDLGDEPSLADLLLGADGPRAREGAVASATTLGTLHATTVGHADDFYRRRAVTGTVDPEADRFGLRGLDVRHLVRDLPSHAARHGLPATAGISADLDLVVAELAEPGDLLALSTGDPCPDNERATADGVRLFDFDGATVRHALVDAAHYVVPFPNCWCWRALPDDLSLAMLAAHRAPLATVSAQAADDGRYAEALARATAAWVLWVLAAHLHRVATEPLSRSRVIGALARFVPFAAAGGHLPDLQRWCEAVLADLRSAGPDAGSTPYPAFGGPVWVFDE